MTLSEICKLLKAEVLTGDEFLEREINFAFASDLMSDVLAYANETGILLTGLINQQVIRTAEMIDLHAIVFVRGKRPTEDMIKLAKLNDITILVTNYIMYTACGKLYNNGLKGVEFE